MIYLSLIIGITILYLFLALTIKKQNFTSPLFINNITWLIVAIFGVLFHDLLYSFTIEIFILWLSWIFITNNFFLLFTIKGNCSPFIFSKSKDIKLPNYWPLLAIASLFLIKNIIDVGFSSSLPFLLNLRLANLNKDGPFLFSFMLKIYPLIFSLFLYEVLLNNNKLNLLFLTITMIFYTLIISGKLNIITPIISFIFIRSLSSKIKWSKIFIYFFSALTLMLILHFNRSNSSDTKSILQMLTIYIYSPIIALGEITPYSSSNFGESSLRFFYALLYKTNLSDIEPINVVLDYVYIPKPTNVYTVMYPFYIDFGITGIIFGALIYGALFSFLYNSYIRGKTIFLLIYVALITTLITSFFSEQIAHNFSEKLQTIIWITIIGFLYEKRKN